MRPVPALLHVGRGALIGLVEIVPGVSGGTVALVLGVYESLIGSAGHLVRGVVGLVSGPLRGQGTAAARAELRAVQWGLVLPVLVGMALAVVTAARLLAPLIEEHPHEARAFFAGLILVSIAVPARMVGGRWRPREVACAAVAAAVTFALTGLSPATVEDPSLWAVAPAAAVAVCALVLPGVSGSFILLAMGLYAPTLAAVNERDLAYIAAFGLGAVAGLAAFVEALRWLLERHRRTTLAVMTGAMIGSLRALWPWQDDSGAMLAPADDLGQVAVFFVAGVLVVATALLARRLGGPRLAASLPATQERPRH